MISVYEVVYKRTKDDYSVTLIYAHNRTEAVKYIRDVNHYEKDLEIVRVEFICNLNI